MSTCDAAARHRLLTQYRPLVQRIAGQMMRKVPSSVDVDDLIQAGLIGLNTALERFDAAQGVPFEGFAIPRVQGAMLDELRSQDWMSRGERTQRRTLDKAAARLEQSLGRAPQDHEIAQDLELSIEQYRELMSRVGVARLVYFEDMRDSEGGESYLERLADETANPVGELRDRRMREALVREIERLPERERLVMSLLYEKDASLKEAAAILGVGDSRVCQIHRQAVERLRRRLADH